MRDTKEYVIWDTITPKAVTSSTDATPIVVTATSHGFSTGDLAMIFGHTTNIAANGIHRVTSLSANTFSLQHRFTGADVAGSGAGAGASGILVPAPKILAVPDFRNVILAIRTGSTATLTVKIAGSIGKSTPTNGTDTPNFGATVSATNPYMFIQSIKLDDGTTVDGNTGVAAAGTDIANSYEVNTNAMKYITVIPTAFTQGTITVKALVTDNE